MHRLTSLISPAILYPFVLALSCCSGSGPGPAVEQLTLDIMDHFETRVPEFEGFLSHAVDCAIDEDGWIYVLDQIECHVVVFDRDLVVVNVIGRKGEGPGEMMITPYNPHHYLAAGGGYVVTAAAPNFIHVFDKDGNFINRFVPDYDPSDLAVRDDGTIITHAYNDRISIVEYDIHGNLLREYGPALIRPGENDPLRRVFITHNNSTVTTLSGDGILTFNDQWMRARFYRNGEFSSEFTIDLEELALLVDTPRADLKVVRTMQREIRNHSPERINQLAETRSLAQDDFPRMRTIFRANADGENIWGAFDNWLCQLTAGGHVSRVFDIENGGSHNFAIRNGQVVFSTGTSISVGTIPEAR